MLKNNLPKRNRHIGALETNVFEPALSLHQRMACSSFTYQLATPKLRRGERRVDTKVVSWKLQDMVKWRPINMEDIGGIFQCLYPAVFRVGKTRKEDVFVCEATILAYDLGEGPKTPRGPLMASLTPLHESPRESPQQSPRGSPDRHYRGIRKAYTDEVHRDIITVIPDEGGHSRNWRRHNTAPVPSPTTNAVKPKHRGKFLDRFRTPLEPSNPETAFDDDPSKSRSRSGPAKRGSSVEPDQPVMSRDFAPKSKSQPPSRRPSYSTTGSVSTREPEMPLTHTAASTRREPRHKARPSDIDEEVLNRDGQGLYNERPKCRDPAGFERYMTHEESMNSQRHG